MIRARRRCRRSLGCARCRRRRARAGSCGDPRRALEALGMAVLIGPQAKHQDAFRRPRRHRRHSADRRSRLRRKAAPPRGRAVRPHSAPCRGGVPDWSANLWRSPKAHSRTSPVKRSTTYRALPALWAGVAPTEKDCADGDHGRRDRVTRDAPRLHQSHALSIFCLRPCFAIRSLNASIPSFCKLILRSSARSRNARQPSGFI